jgi:hypothetical protein
MRIPYGYRGPRQDVANRTRRKEVIMSARQAPLLTQLSVADIKGLLKVKEKIESLEARKMTLANELDGIDRELDKLAKQANRLGAAPGRRPAKKAKKKKATKKRAKRGAKKTARVAKKTTRKKAKATSRRTTKKTAKKAPRKRGKVRRAARGRRGQPTLADVVADLIAHNGGPMAYKDILTAITEGKLFRSRSKNFDNVLRRTLSTSDRIRRVGRGVYGLA